MIEHQNKDGSIHRKPLDGIALLRERFAQLRAGLAESGISGDLKSLYIRTCVLADMCEQLCTEIMEQSFATARNRPRGTSVADPTARFAEAAEPEEDGKEGVAGQPTLPVRVDQPG